jgi:tripartite-type tricarboxylate transporter receptor subunit TctC
MRIRNLKTLALVVACVGSLAGMVPQALAQDYPTRPVTMVVPFPAGTGTDNMVRPLANELQKSLGQPIVVDNKPGAQGVIGTTFVARAKGDGYTLLVGSVTTLAANVGLFKTLPFDPMKDFQPVVGLGSTSMMFLVRSDSQTPDLKSFLDWARSQPAPVTVGYASSSGHVALALLSKVTGIKFTPVAYKGSPQALTDVIGGQIRMAVVDVGSGAPHVKASRLNGLAITGARRSPSVPNVPMLAESYPNNSLVTWIGLVAPAGTPPEVVNKLYQAISKVLSTPEMVEKFAASSFDVEVVSPADLGKRMQADQTQWVQLIRAAGIEPQ